jgi:hypothetical protein
VQDEGDDGRDQQEMNKEAADVHHGETQDPADQQDDEENQKHLSPLEIGAQTDAPGCAKVVSVPVARHAQCII